MTRPLTAQTIEMDNLVDLRSRETSASTSGGRIDIFTLQDLDRESTADSLPVRAHSNCSTLADLMHFYFLADKGRSFASIKASKNGINKRRRYCCIHKKVYTI